MRPREVDPDQASGLTKRVAATARTVVATSSTTGERALAAGKLGVGSAATVAAATALVDVIAPLAHQHQALVSAMTPGALAGGILGSYVFIASGAGIALDRTAGHRYSRNQLESVGGTFQTVGVASTFIGTTAGAVGLGVGCYESVGHHVAANAALMAWDAPVTAMMLSVGATALIGARLVRGPRPKSAPSLAE